jgi:Fe-S cluster assembly protein SufD
MNIAPEQAINHYLEEFNRVARQLAGHHLPWLQAIKQQALADFTAQGFPTLRHEDWKYTNVAPITKQSFQTSKQKINDALAQINIAPFLANELMTHRLVFIDGYFEPTLSSINNLPTGVLITNLAQALAENNKAVKYHLNKLASQNSHAFKQLNTIFMQDGAFIHLASHAQLNQPIYLVFINTEDQNTPMHTLRNLIIAEENSQANIIENYLSIGQNNYFTNTLTEIMLYKNAQITHYKLEQENQKAFHIGTVEVQQHDHSHFTSHSFAFGGALVRSDINIQLAAEHTTCTLNGLYLASGKQHIDHHTTVNHLKPHGTSREYYKGVLMDRARAIFNGKVQVAEGAYKTNAQQTNKNLLLSSEAEIDTKPQLEIYADDVQCTHGAAVGQLDEDALFYLRARGINEAQARSLLIYAFIQELFEQIPLQTLRQYLQNNLSHILPAQLALEQV